MTFIPDSGKLRHRAISLLSRGYVPLSPGDVVACLNALRVEDVSESELTHIAKGDVARFDAGDDGPYICPAVGPGGGDFRVWWEYLTLSDWSLDDRVVEPGSAVRYQRHRLRAVIDVYEQAVSAARSGADIEALYDLVWNIAQGCLPPEMVARHVESARRNGNTPDFINIFREVAEDFGVFEPKEAGSSAFSGVLSPDLSTREKFFGPAGGA